MARWKAPYYFPGAEIQQSSDQQERVNHRVSLRSQGIALGHLLFIELCSVLYINTDVSMS